MFKRREANVITRRLTDTAALSDHLRLRGAMFNHHMPWGYNGLFEGYGDDMEKVSLGILDSSSLDAKCEAEQVALKERLAAEAEEAAKATKEEGEEQVIEDEGEGEQKEEEEEEVEKEGQTNKLYPDLSDM